MATIGQSLIVPESGWTRYDNTNENITYSILSGTGSWSTANSSSHYGGSISFLSEGRDGEISFNFTGTKLRILAYTGSVYSDSMEISIDGIEETYSTAMDSTFTALVYEKNGLSDGEHSVKITNNNFSTKRMGLDAVDVEEGAQLLPYTPFVFKNKFLIKNNNAYKYYSTSTNQWVTINDIITEEVYLNLGINDISSVPESAWKLLSGMVEIFYYTNNSVFDEIQLSIETEPFTLSDELGSTFNIIEYTDNPTQEDSAITVETKPYSVYDYISETPEVLVYNESEDDITVETTTEPFTIYDEFGDEVEVLHYTDDESVTETDLILEANYSPIDELEGDFEVVTWTDELEDTERVLEINGITTPKFIHQLEQVSVGELLKVLVNDNSETNIGKSNVRYLFSSDNTNWYSFKNNSFTRVNPINNDTIKVNGNTAIELLSIKEEQFKTWSFDKINVGVYLEDDVRDNITSKIGENVITHESYIDSPLITGNSLYILNTTALIDVELIGNSIFGELSDEDATRVQYRVSLNGEPYFPTDGEYTTLAESPQSIGINFTSSEININDWNDVVIEFKDYFGKEDSWSARFIGRYSGILFRDENGENYSTDVGAILKYLDFGTVITGQFTPVYKVMLKNTYGFDVKELKLEANTEGFPEGLVVEFDTEQEFNNPRPSLTMDFLANDDETPFYIRMNSPINTQPNGANYFDIYVSAKRDV